MACQRAKLPASTNIVVGGFTLEGTDTMAPEISFQKSHPYRTPLGPPPSMKDHQRMVYRQCGPVLPRLRQTLIPLSLFPSSVTTARLPFLTCGRCAPGCSLPSFLGSAASCPGRRPPRRCLSCARPACPSSPTTTVTRTCDEVPHSQFSSLSPTPGSSSKTTPGLSVARRGDQHLADALVDGRPGRER